MPCVGSTLVARWVMMKVYSTSIVCLWSDTSPHRDGMYMITYSCGLSQYVCKLTHVIVSLRVSKCTQPAVAAHAPMVYPSSPIPYMVAADDEQTYMGCRREHMSCSCPTPTYVPRNNVADVMMDTMLWRHSRLDAPQASLALPLQHDCVLSCSATGKGPAHGCTMLLTS